VTTGLVMLAGEITTKAVLDYSDIARASSADGRLHARQICFDARPALLFPPSNASPRTSRWVWIPAGAAIKA